ncbi:MAG: DUF1835 domain-containing protein [Candidatus Nitrohelix vancouverensis]|uniref:DUF1835 domain-containing protein n=1 Tax=Candidatus Nitrohelix vancouverensis TaxID=2705534 RepID=A0A7T0C350_9BACT|nr:MAG: DUF1835 domain-containing protein [Candidatus Nitrohelix vancouverensis]
MHNVELLITNGDSAAHLLQQAGIGSKILPWRDVLHEGPIPQDQDDLQLAETRARFIVSQRWGEYGPTLKQFRERDELLARGSAYNRISLWFEHDLYDQLQLLQVLDRCKALPLDKLFLVQATDFLGTQTPESIAEFRKLERPVTGEQIALAQSAWQALRAPSPEALANLAGNDLAELPFLKNSLTRLLKELPSTSNGLNLTQQHILQIVGQNPEITARELFGKYNEAETPAFMGDWSFWRWLDGMTMPSHALIDGLPPGGYPFRKSREQASIYLQSKLSLSALGESILNGAEDLIDTLGIDRWVGGVHLTTTDCWRWDPENHRPQAPK